MIDQRSSALRSWIYFPKPEGVSANTADATKPRLLRLHEVIGWAMPLPAEQDD